MDNGMCYYNIQIMPVLLFSLLSTVIVILANPKRPKTYNFTGLLKFIYRNIVFLSSFSGLFISSVFLIKCNIKGISSDNGWLITIFTLTFINSLAIINYCLLIILEMSTTDLIPLEMGNELIILNNAQYVRYKPKYNLVVIINSIVISLVCCGTIILAVVLNN